MDENMKFVDFEKYCKTCVNSKKKEEEDPCWDCLSHPARSGSQKPIHYEEKEN